MAGTRTRKGDDTTPAPSAVAPAEVRPGVSPIPTASSVNADTNAFTNSLNADDLTIANDSGEASNAENNAVTGSTNTFTPLTTPPNAIVSPTDITSGTQLVTDWLNSIGLGSIAPTVLKWNATGYSHPVILDMIRTSPETKAAYQARFPAIAALQKMDPTVDEGAYIAKENTDRNLLYTYLGDAAKNYDNPAQLGTLMSNWVSTSELQNRLQAVHDVVNSSPDTKAWLQSTYGYSPQDLAAAWLDPQLAGDTIAKRDAAAQIGGAGLASGFGNLTQAQAEALANQGVTTAGATTKFGQIGNYGQLEQQLPGSDTGSIDQQGILDATFNGGAAAAKLKAVQDARVAPFQANGGTVADSSGVAGDRLASM